MASLFCLSCATGCDGTARHLGGRPLPRGEPLPVVARIQMSDSFRVSGAMTFDNCSILIAGSEWGTLARIESDGSVSRITARVPGARMRTRLAPGQGDEVIAWSDDPGYWALVTPNLSVTLLPAKLASLEAGVVGPTVGTKLGYFTAVSSSGSPRRSSKPPQELPMGVLRGHRGELLAAIGSIQQVGGEYLTWFASRAVVGAMADTLMVLTLSDGVVTGWVQPYTAPLWTDTLPGYFRVPPAREEVWRWPWIEYGGEIPNVVAVSSASAAGIGSDGTIVAVRNLSATWRKTSTPYSRVKGRWAVIDQILESYSPRGELLRRFEIPSGEVRWVSVDKDNRVYMRIGEEVLVVSISDRHSDCPPIPESVIIDIADGPPSAGQLVVGDGSGARPTMASSPR